MKRFIAAQMDFPTVEPLDAAELAGTKVVAYNLTWTFAPLSHKDLTVAFALSSSFYLVLYCLVGVLSWCVMAIFMAYHRLVARPRKEGGEVAAFKFYSYLMLTMPPALSGTGLAMVPVSLINIWISVMVSGHVF